MIRSPFLRRGPTEPPMEVAFRYYRLNIAGTGASEWSAVATLSLRDAVAAPSHVTGDPASASSFYTADFTPDKAFDIEGTNTSTYWLSADKVFVAEWLGVDAGAPFEVVEYAIKVVTAQNAHRSAPRDWTLEGSNDGVTWTVLDRRAGEAAFTSGEIRVYTPVREEPADPVFYDDFGGTGSLHGSLSTSGAEWFGDAPFTRAEGIMRAQTSNYDNFVTVTAGKTGEQVIEGRLHQAGQWVGLIFGASARTSNRPGNCWWVEADNSTFYLFQNVNGARTTLASQPRRGWEPSLTTPHDWHIEVRPGHIAFYIDRAIVLAWHGDTSGVGPVIGFQAGAPATYEWSDLRVR